MNALIGTLLIIALVVFRPTPVYSMDSCPAYLGSLARLEHIKKRIFETTGIVVIENADILDRAGLNSAWSNSRRVIYLHPDREILLKHVDLHHEVVHALSDSNFLKNPTAANAALNIRFKRQIIPLSPELHYLEEYQLDEFKAYFKNSYYYYSLGFSEPKDSPEAKAYLDEANSNVTFSVTFASNSYKILSQLEPVLKKAQTGGPLVYRVTPYHSPAPDYYVLEVDLPQPEGDVITVSMPVYDPDVRASGKPMKDVSSKLLEVCHAGMKHTGDHLLRFIQN